MSNGLTRDFRYALLASAVLHALALFALPQVRVARPHLAVPPVMTARIVELPPPAPVIKEPQVAPPPLPERKAESKPIQKPKHRVLVAKAKKPARHRVAPPVHARPAPAPPVVASVAPTPTPTPAPAGPDPNALAQYRHEIAEAARKFKHYPPVAMDNDWEGEVVVRVVVGPGGKAQSVKVKSSSGHGVLDDQALEMFRRALALAEVPAPLRTREFTLELRAVYHLKDQG